MKAKGYLSMEPNMLYSVVNMRLRNDYRNLDDMVNALELDRAELEQRLRMAGFDYRPELNQFRPTAR